MMIHNRRQFLQKNPWLKEIAWQVAMPLALLALVFFFFPERARFAFSADEGYQLMWAMLFDHGYDLYTEIWIDQPPLMTYSLWAVFQVAGYKVGAARYLILLFSAGLVWGAFQYLRLMWDEKHALAGTLLLIMLPNYLQLSVSIMQAIPNLAFGVISLFFLLKWHKTHNYLWLILSAGALGGAILTKLYIGFLAPVFVIGLLIGEYSRLKEQRHRYLAILPPLVWGLVLSALLITAAFYWIGLENLHHLLSVHLVKSETVEESQYFSIARQIRSSLPFLILALIGVIELLRKREWLILYPLSWSILAYVMLSFYSPVWPHHKLLVTVPAALICAYPARLAVEFIGSMFQIIRTELSPLKKYGIQILSSIGLLLIFLRPPEGLNVLSVWPSLSGSGLGMKANEEKLLSLMNDYRSQTNWVVADNLMYPARARLFVPPNLAIISSSRLNTGFLRQAEIIESIQEYRPEQVLIGHFELPEVEEYIQDRYYLIHSYQNIKLYIRNDLPDLTLEQ